MPAKSCSSKNKVCFVAKGRLVSFKAKAKPKRSPAQIRKVMKRHKMSPKMIKHALMAKKNGGF